jgi:hypothetical protein
MKKRRFKKEQIMVYFIAFIMISSVFGVIFYGYSGGGTEVSYNEFIFLREEGGNKWSTEIDGKQMFFDYFPTEVEQTNVSAEIINKLSNTVEIDVTYDVNSSKKEVFAYVGYDMQQQLANKNIYVRLGFLTESEYDVPIISCADATAIVPVLYLKESNGTKVYAQGNCIIVEAGGDFDFIRLKDRILFSIFGIME